MHRARATFVRGEQRNDTYSIDFIHEYHEYRDGECNKLVNEATIPEGWIPGSTLYSGNPLMYGIN